MLISGTRGVLLTPPVTSPNPSHRGHCTFTMAYSVRRLPPPSHTHRPGPCSHRPSSFNIFSFLPALPLSPATPYGGGSQQPVCSAPQRCEVLRSVGDFRGSAVCVRAFGVSVAVPAGKLLCVGRWPLRVVATHPLGPVTLSLRAGWPSEE